MKYKWIKHYSFKLAILFVMIGAWQVNQPESRNYTGLTAQPYPDIAIELFKEQPVVWRTPHKLSMKKLTKTGNLKQGGLK